MTHTNSNTSLSNRKHLTYQDRCKIEAYCEEKLSFREIARRLGKHHSTISQEVKRGTVRQIKQVVKSSSGKTYEYDQMSYSADAGQASYTTARTACGRPPKWHQLADFLDWADERMLKDHWSPEAVLGYAKKEELFSECDLPCVTTLYEWINHGITRTKNINLLEKTSRKPSGRRSRIRKRSSLGTSIEERPKSIETREEFGHWEIDTVIGAKDATDDVLLTLVERQTRFEYLIRIPAKTSCAVQEAVNQLLENAGEDAKYLFKSITTDNGKEFTHLEDAFKEYLAVYYCHPYSSWERGSSENQHRLIRRFIPKGTRMDSVSDRQLKRIQRWMNDYPRKSLHFNTAHDLLVKAFERERNAA